MVPFIYLYDTTQACLEMCMLHYARHIGPTCTTSLLTWKLADILANHAIKKMLMCYDGLVEDEMHLLF